MKKKVKSKTSRRRDVLLGVLVGVGSCLLVNATLFLVKAGLTILLVRSLAPVDIR